MFGESMKWGFGEGRATEGVEGSDGVRHCSESTDKAGASLTARQTLYSLEQKTQQAQCVTEPGAAAVASYSVPKALRYSGDGIWEGNGLHEPAVVLPGRLELRDDTEPRRGMILRVVLAL